MTLRLSSPEFGTGKRIPRRFSGEGDDVSPPLVWTGVPPGTKELALICDDPDAPRSTPWVHWLVAGIPPSWSGLPEGVDDGALVEGITDFGDVGHGGPMPPKGNGVHHYHFRLIALDAPLTLREGFTKVRLLQAVEGHVLAEAGLIGTYERT